MSGPALLALAMLLSVWIVIAYRLTGCAKPAASPGVYPTP